MGHDYLGHVRNDRAVLYNAMVASQLRRPNGGYNGWKSFARDIGRMERLSSSTAVEATPARDVHLLRGGLNRSEVDTLLALASDPDTFVVDDRSDAIIHTMMRVEYPLLRRQPALLRKLLGWAEAVDRAVWSGRLDAAASGGASAVYPEVELLTYNASSQARQQARPHVDNGAALSLIAMLDPPESFDGGDNFFKRDPADLERGGLSSAAHCATQRRVRLRRGDVAFFRGEVTTHWVSPVTRGLRRVLQIELQTAVWKGQRACDASGEADEAEAEHAVEKGDDVVRAIEGVAWAGAGVSSEEIGEFDGGGGEGEEEEEEDLDDEELDDEEAADLEEWAEIDRFSEVLWPYDVTVPRW